MRKRSDKTRDPAAASAVSAAEDVGRLVKELALALHRPAAPVRQTTLMARLSAGPAADRNNELPQILKPKPSDPKLPGLSTWRAGPASHTSLLGGLGEQLAASALRLATGLGAAGLLVLGSIGAFNSFANLNPKKYEPVPVLAREDASPAVTAQASELVQESQRLITRGDITGARVLLGQAVTVGDALAMRMLAETFDPNMLAAWGARGQTADAGAAKELYGRALLAGEARARQRLEALGAAP